VAEDFGDAAAFDLCQGVFPASGHRYVRNSLILYRFIDR
jgi:hypothetical protein